jgi:hypothetical protein
MREIANGMVTHADDIQSMSKDTMGKPYDVSKAVAEIKSKFPKSFASRDKTAPGAETEPEELLSAVPESHLEVREDLRQYLAPDFNNRVNPDVTSNRIMRVYTMGAQGQKNYDVQANSVDDAIQQTLVRNPNLSPGSITRIAKAD